MLKPETQVSVSPDVIFNELQGEAVLLNMRSGQYYGLDPVGTRIWSLVQQHGRLEAIYEQLLDEFDVTPGRLRSDITALLEQLESKGLVHFSNPPSQG